MLCVCPGEGGGGGYPRSHTTYRFYLASCGEKSGFFSTAVKIKSGSGLGMRLGGAVYSYETRHSMGHVRKDS